MGKKRSKAAANSAATTHSTAASSNLTPRPLRFVSWNILADSLAKHNPWLYKHCHPGALHDRLPRVMEGLGRINADVVALQEAEFFERDIEPYMARLGYTGAFKKRTGDDQSDGVVLLWKADRLELSKRQATTDEEPLINERLRERTGA